MLNMCIVAGARPNFIKVAPIIHAIREAKKERKEVSYTLVYTGREDDETLEPSLFEDLQIERPQIFLEIDSVSLNELTGKVMWAFEQYLNKNTTDVVIVVDDLASTMATAIVAKKHGVRLAHLVAGTRSFDINMPKEINRLVIDGLSDILFTAGTTSSSTAMRGGAEMSKIYMVGNILLDTLRNNRSRLKRPACLSGIEDREYIVFTLNRKKLIDDGKALEKKIRAIMKNAGNMPVFAPLREKAKEALGHLSAEFPTLHIIEPLGYLEFSYLTANACGVITDSGNIAEETTFNNIPCITLNNYTEHIETVTIGTNVLVGENTELLASYVADMANKKWKEGTLPDRWDGRSANRILQILYETQENG